MTAFLNKHRVWLPVILMISSISLSLANKPENDAGQELGKPAGTAGYIQNEELEKSLKPPGGTQKYRQLEPFNDVQSHPSPELKLRGNIKDPLERNEESEKPFGPPAGTRGNH